MSHSVTSIGLFIPIIILFVSNLFWFRKYTGFPGDTAFLAILASSIAAACQIIYRLRSSMNTSHPVGEEWIFLSIIAGGFFIVIATAFAMRLWGRFVGGKMTPEEAQPGQAGIRAWFCTSNVIISICLIVFAWVGYDISPLLTTVVVGAILAAHPLLRIESAAAAAPATPNAFPGEREKIVSMLEAGKITADECAELLQALSETSRAPSRQTPLTGGQRLLLIGAALVALGFFLPWFVINPGKEAGRMMNQVQSSMNSTFRGDGNFPDGAIFSGAHLETPTMSMSGGDIGRGLGWAALALALVAALLPYVATTLDTATARTVRLLCLGVGGIIVLYLLTQNIRFVGIGLVIAVSGYALEIAGALRERHATGS